MKVTINNEVLEFNHPITLKELIDESEHKYFAAKVNNRLRELNYKLHKSATIEFLDLCNADSVRMYQTTLRYVIVMAIKNLYKDARIVFNYSISRSIFCEVKNIGHALDPKILQQIQNEVDRIIAANYPIERKTITIEEANQLYSSLGYQDKCDVLKYRSEKYVHINECNGYKNYMFGYMLPSTGYLIDYRFRLYSPGFVIQYPRSECQGRIPPFEDAPNFQKALIEANRWGKIIDGSYIGKMNEIIRSNRAIEFINICETKHNNMLAELGENIAKEIKNIRLIAVAGPSSSGKTTFTNRLRIELITRGINPVMISIDDYYLGKDMAPKDENGDPDLEHIEALDLELFNNDIYNLIQGEEVTLPIFNFQTGKREKGRTIKIDENTPLLIEGIHALNEKLLPSIPVHQVYKIYIAPQAQLHIDDQNPISITDIRLIRRLVRDMKFRNADPSLTFSMWDSVRRGEFKWIYPYQENANYVFNSELTYELCVLKKYAMDMLAKIDNDDEYFITANRLIKFLKYFDDIDDKWIPCNSILREFIGGSMFYDN